MVTEQSCAVHLTRAHAHPIPNNKKKQKTLKMHLFIDHIGFFFPGMTGLIAIKPFYMPSGKPENTMDSLQFLPLYYFLILAPSLENEKVRLLSL